MYTSVRSQAGMVTAEAALALPLLLVVLLCAVSAELAVSAKIRCLDAAHEAARLAAAGSSDAVLLQAARHLAPPHPRVQVARVGQWVEVVVTADVHPFPIGPGVSVTARETVMKDWP